MTLTSTSATRSTLSNFRLFYRLGVPCSAISTVVWELWRWPSPLPDFLRPSSSLRRAPAATAAPTPKPAFAGRSLVLKTVAAGEVWRRMYETRHPDPLGWGPGLNRFSDPTGRAFGIVYLGSSAKVAFVETLLRDATDGRAEDCVLELTEIEARSLVSISVKDPLRLVDLTGDGLRTGAPSDVVGSSDQTLAQQWSAAFHVDADQPDGVYYPSRLNEERCIALYDRAIGKLEAVATPRLVE